MATKHAETAKPVKDDNAWVVRFTDVIPAWLLAADQFSTGWEVISWMGPHGMQYAHPGDTIVNGPDGLLLQEKTRK